MARQVFACDDCGWEWPEKDLPPLDLVCPECGGEVGKVNEVLVALMDTLEAALDVPVYRYKPR